MRQRTPAAAAKAIVVVALCAALVGVGGSTSSAKPARQAQADPYPLTFSVVSTSCDTNEADLSIVLTNNADQAQSVANTLATLADGTMVQVGWTPSTIDPGGSANASATVPLGTTLTITVSLVSDQGDPGAAAGSYTVPPVDCPTTTAIATSVPLTANPTTPPAPPATAQPGTASFTG